MNLRRIVVAAVFGSLLASSAAMAEPLHFGPDSMTAIESRHAGEPFLAVLWSTDCAPCRDELALLSEFRAAHPELAIVLISTDGTEHEDAVRAVLAAERLAAVESWLFADANADRLRFSIDPEWFGEMPRAYLYDAESGRRGISGALSERLLLEWLRAAEERHPAAGE